jgi:hypothetical protein
VLKPCIDVLSTAIPIEYGSMISVGFVLHACADTVLRSVRFDSGASQGRGTAVHDLAAPCTLPFTVLPLVRYISAVRHSLALMAQVAQ